MPIAHAPPVTLLPIMVASFITACAGDAGLATDRDSAGIRIIENHAPRLDENDAIRLSATPAVTVGDRDDAPHMFARVVGAARLSDGRIVVADGMGSRQLRFFDSTGNFLRSVGRGGRGPGEFPSLVRLYQISGDTLLAGAYEHDLLVFTGAGDYVRNVAPLAPFPAFPRGVNTQTLARVGAEQMFVGGFSEPASPSGRPIGERWVHPFTLAIPHADSASARIIGEFPLHVFSSQENGRREVPWFSAYLAFAYNDSALFLGFGNEYSIRRFAPDGTLQRIIRRIWTPVLVTQDDIERLVVEQSKRWAGAPAEQIDGWVKWLRSEPVADTVPAFAMMLADRAGRLWVREARLIDESVTRGLQGMPQEGSNWSVFDNEGRWLCDVAMPALFLPYEIGSDYVLGAGRGPNDEETVQMYRLEGGGER